MLSRHLVRSLRALAVASAPAFAQDSKVMPREQTIHRTATAGVPLRAFGYAIWSRECVAGTVPTSST